MGPRNQIVSISRSVAIMAMVLGHAFVCTKVECWVNQFDMAVFFVCAGFCFNIGYLERPLDFVKRRVVGIVVPFIFWVSVCIILHNFFVRWGILAADGVYRGQDQHLYSAREVLVNVGNAFLLRNSEQLLGGYWFLHDLFFVSLCAIGFFLLLCRVLKKSLRVGILLGLFLSGALILLGGGARPIIGLFLFMIGVWMREMNVINFLSRLPFYTKMSVLVVLGLLFWRMGMCGMLLSNPERMKIPEFLIASISGVILVFLVSEKLSASPCLAGILSYVGDASLTILTLHLFAFKFFSWLLLLLGVPGRLSDFPTLPLSAIGRSGYFVVGVVLPIAFHLLYKYIIRKFDENCKGRLLCGQSKI